MADSGTKPGGTPAGSALIRRRTVVAGAAWAAPAVVGMNALPAWALSPGQQPPCLSKTFTQVRGAGRFLSGTLLGLNLDNIAQLDGVTVTSNGTAGNAVATPTSATQLSGEYSPYAYSAKVDLTVLSLINALAAVGLDLNTDLGAINQYGRAVYNGNSAGGSGAVDEASGAVNLQSNGGYPSYAKVNVRTLVGSLTNPALATALASVGDVSLDIGAVAGRAETDLCSTTLTRQYLLAYIKTIVTVPAVATLLKTVKDTINGDPNATPPEPALVDALVNGITGPGGALSTLLASLQNVLNPTLHVLLLHLADLGVSITLNSSSVLDGLLSNQLSDSGGVLTVDLTGPQANAVTVDTGALLGKPWNEETGSRLSNLPPNTELLINDDVIEDTLEVTLESVLQGWINNIVNALKNALTVNITLNLVTWEPSLIPPGFGSPGSITVAKIVISGSVNDLLNGTFVADVTLGDADLLNAILSILVGTTVKPLVATLGLAIGNLISGTLTGATSTLAGSVVTALSGLYSALYASKILSLTANAQNDPTSGSAEPTDVAALRLAVIGSAQTVLAYLGRASVGPNLPL